jgi:hypothetical protein
LSPDRLSPLVADPVAQIEEPRRVQFGDREVLVDTPHEILVNKLCALLGRAEVRDLQDVRALLAAGGDFEDAVAAAPRKDGGFSPMTLAWVLNRLDLATGARLAGLPQGEAEELDRFRVELADRLRDLSDPGQSREPQS